jgi:hypothetical protein
MRNLLFCLVIAALLLMRPGRIQAIFRKSNNGKSCKRAVIMS